MLTVLHREDALLQTNAMRPIDEQFKGTAIETSNIPSHRMLLDFLNERVIGKYFKDQAHLQLILDEWPLFTLERGLKPGYNMFSDGFVISRGVIQSRTGEPRDDPFHIARILETERNAPLYDSTYFPTGC